MNIKIYSLFSFENILSNIVVYRLTALEHKQIITATKILAIQKLLISNPKLATFSDDGCADATVGGGSCGIYEQENLLLSIFGALALSPLFAVNCTAVVA